MGARFASIAAVLLLAARVFAQPVNGTADAAVDPEPLSSGITSTDAPASPSADAELSPVGNLAQNQPSFGAALLSRVQFHGFVSAGAFLSTDNNYIGKSSRGDLRLFEAGVNFSIELTDDLRVGLQFVSRSVGTLSEEVPRLDWGVIDYRFRSWLGIRAGVIKTPFGLYNEYIAVDAARTPILLPQSVYPLRNRDALISHTGFALYGSIDMRVAGRLEYQAWLGRLTVPRSALELIGAELDSVDSKYVTGGQLFYSPPVEGLRVGATYLHASIDFNLTIDAAITQQLVQAGLASSDFTGALLITQDPLHLWIGSVEYSVGDLVIAAEYSRWFKVQKASLPALVPTLREDNERFYAMVSYRISPHFEAGTYYSVTHLDADDRRGTSAKFAKRRLAFQRDLAATLRIDLNEYWLFKLEGHFIDGAAELLQGPNPNPTRYWGLFLFRTTVTF